MRGEEEKREVDPDRQQAPETSSEPEDSSGPEEPPDPWTIIKRWIYRRLGLPGLVALLLISAIGVAWWNWGTLRTLPGIAPIVEWASQSNLRKADPQRFTVALAHLQNDEDRQYENLIFQRLNQQFASQEKNAVQILRCDRTIRRQGPDPEVSGRKGHEKARAYLLQSGADVLIWGAVLKVADKSEPNLYWTPRRGVEPARDWGRYRTEDLELPEVFWEDLIEILQLLVVTRDAEFRSLEGRFVADRLRPFIEKIRHLLTSGAEGWSEQIRARVRFVLAGSLETLGEQAGANDALAEAIVLYREALKEYTRERVPLDWAMTQNNLSTALARLGEREAGTAGLEQAVAAYREALKEYIRERVPLDWAMTQNNLGGALARLGEREAGTERLEEAVAAYREALKEWTRERVPLQWAGTQNNLGNALRSLGEREAGTAGLEQAVATFREALKERTRERVPLQWAMTQNNLGTALGSLGEQQKDVSVVCEALGAHLAAWEVFAAGDASHYAAIAKGGVERDVALLRDAFDQSEYNQCLARHHERLQALRNAEK